MGLLYEPFRFIRMLLRHNAAAVFIEDTLYLSLWGFISFIIALSVGIGYFRIYYIVFEFLGAALYLLTVGRVINFLMRKSVRAVKSFFRTIFNKVKSFLSALFSPFAKKTKALFVKIAKNTSTVVLNHKKDLKNRDKMVYNVKEPLYKGGESSSVIKAKIRKKA